MFFKSQKIAYISVEVTGEDVHKNSIWELSIKVTDNSGNEISKFERVIKPTKIENETFWDNKLQKTLIENSKTFNFHAETILEVLKDVEILVCYKQSYLQFLNEEFMRLGFRLQDLTFAKANVFSLKTFWEKSEPRELENAANRWLGVGLNNLESSSEICEQLLTPMTKTFGKLYEAETYEDFLISSIDFKIIDASSFFKQDVKTNSIYFAKGKHIDKNVIEVLKTDSQYFNWMLGCGNDMSEHTKQIVKFFLSKFTK